MWAIPCLHGPRRHQHLRYEDNVVPELDANYSHPCDQSVVHDGVRGETVIQRLYRKPIHFQVLGR